MGFTYQSKNKSKNTDKDGCSYGLRPSSPPQLKSWTSRIPECNLKVSCWHEHGDTAKAVLQI